MGKLGDQLVHGEQYCFATTYYLTASPFDVSRAINKIKILYLENSLIIPGTPLGVL